MGSDRCTHNVLDGHHVRCGPCIDRKVSELEAAHAETRRELEEMTTRARIAYAGTADLLDAMGDQMVTMRATGPDGARHGIAPASQMAPVYRSQAAALTPTPEKPNG